VGFGIKGVEPLCSATIQLIRQMDLIIFFFFTFVSCIVILSTFFYSPTNAQMIVLKQY